MNDLERDGHAYRFCLRHGFPRLHQTGDVWVMWANTETAFPGGSGKTPDAAVRDAMTRMGVTQ